MKVYALPSSRQIFSVGFPLDKIVHEAVEKEEVIVLTAVDLPKHDLVIVNQEVVDGLNSGKVSLGLTQLCPPECCLSVFKDHSLDTCTMEIKFTSSGKLYYENRKRGCI